MQEDPPGSNAKHKILDFIQELQLILTSKFNRTGVPPKVVSERIHKVQRYLFLFLEFIRAYMCMLFDVMDLCLSL